MNLSEWQALLTDRFAAISDHRQATTPGAPVFAFEHGLSRSELDELGSNIRDHTTGPYINRGNWLPWVVHATEVGYTYSGIEYWPVFEESIPGWRFVGDPNFIRSAFIKFKNKFGGYEPKGIWATHFSIICWPIFHSILPKDFQWQLASVLHEISTYVDYDDLHDANELGRIIHGRSATRSTRFFEFTSEITLVGQLAHALLSDQENLDKVAINRVTLARISADLRDEQQAKHWLDLAQNNAARTRRRGLRSAIHKNSAGSKKGQQSFNQSSVQMTLELMRIESDKWDVYARTADPSELVTDVPEIGRILSDSKSRVYGESHVLARGRLVSGSTMTRLNKWPDPEDKPVTLYPSDRTVEDLFSDRKFRATEPRWLFEQNGATAKLVGNNSAKIGTKYILALRDGIPLEASSDQIREISVSSDGILAFEVDLTEELHESTQGCLAQNGIVVQRSMILEPVGTGPIEWDASGYSVWDRDDTPTFQLSSEQPITSVSIENTRSGISVNSEFSEPERSIFFELGDLEMGEHDFKLELCSGVSPSTPMAGTFQVVVVATRGPTDRHLGIPIQLVCDPPTPTLDALLDGSAEINVELATGQKASLSAELFTQQSVSPSATKSNLPIAGAGHPIDIQNLLHSQLHVIPEFSENYDSARSLRLTLDAGEWGMITKEFERDFVPLRWSVIPSDRGRRLQLFDQVSGEAPKNFSYATFTNPSQFFSIDSSALTELEDFGIFGGLYRATKGQFEDTVILPGPDPPSGSEFVQKFVAFDRKPTYAMRIWGNARVSSDFATQERRESVISALTSTTFEGLCGDGWDIVENTAICPGSEADEIIDSATGFVDFRFQNALDSQIAETAVQPTEIRLNSFTYVSSIDLKANREQSEFALRLASDINAAYSFAGERYSDLLEQVSAKSELLRRARLLALAVTRYGGNKQDSVQDVPGWDWR